MRLGEGANLRRVDHHDRQPGGAQAGRHHALERARGRPATSAGASGCSRSSSASMPAAPRPTATAWPATSACTSSPVLATSVPTASISIGNRPCRAGLASRPRRPFGFDGTAAGGQRSHGAPGRARSPHGFVGCRPPPRLALAQMTAGPSHNAGRPAGPAGIQRRVAGGAALVDERQARARRASLTPGRRRWRRPGRGGWRCPGSGRGRRRARRRGCRGGAEAGRGGLAALSTRWGG